ncbi:MAG: EnpEP protein [Paenibacillaceae bacterium]|nr:EnpEP protein [Paenibacillaceae bacterium]
MRKIRFRRYATWLIVLAAAAIISGVWKAEQQNHQPAVGTEPYLTVQGNTANEMATPAPEIPQTPEPLSQRVVEYHMSVTLDATKMRLQGSQNLTWKNPGTVPVKELYFHLYPNAFESKQSTFMKESGGQLRNDKAKADSFGHMRVLSVKTVQGDDLLSRMSFVQPDDGNKNDHTLMKLVLPTAVLPGEQVTLLTQFEVAMPAAFARMGYVGDYVMAGQWYPKLAVYEPKGVRGRTEEGWNLHQYHGNSEFYADFGIFDVVIKVPAGDIVAATGFPTQQPVVSGDVKTYHFYADDVHDFAWAASPHFVYHEEPFSAPNVPGVKIKLYLDPKQQDLKDRYLAAAKKSLTRYSQWYGEYPYSTLSIVVPPPGGNGTGGMEYPTLITAWDATEANPGLDLERVVVHEIGHQYWYGMVASNEFEEAWLDEGFTSYSEDRVMAEEYGNASNLPIEASYITDPAALRQNAWDYNTRGEYADNVYTKAKLALTAIERQVGAQTMNKVLRTYFQRWKFRHPSTEDFQKVLQDVTKADWATFFDQYVYGGLMVDYSIESIHSQPVTVDGKPLVESTIVVQKHGGTAGTVPIEMHLSDGSTVVRMWTVRMRRCS